MKTSSKALIVASVILFAGCSSHSSMVMDDQMTMGDMVGALKGKSGDDLDKAFLEGMIPHHQGAVDMANEVLKNAKHEEIRKMARDIIDTQQKEIDQMKQWQKDWGYAK